MSFRSFDEMWLVNAPNGPRFEDGTEMRCEPVEMLADGLIVSPSAERNKGPAIRLGQTPLPNVDAPCPLDVHDAVWPAENVAAVVCINMIHIAPPSATQALLRGAGTVVAPGGILFLYGPYRREGRHTSPGNEAFDARLRAENPQWGVRDLEDVVQRAHDLGFDLDQVHDMPANNLSVIFRKR
ncbi:MAG: hypothetical protein B7Y61_05655 [Rhizobiales bacterium 35-66-30]|nr:MAG: hypothetical protein B7Y61_05655 [Rhizobiales bacterium 35-66-30]